MKAVQILVDGREVDTLAGHVDLRRPLPAGASWIRSRRRPPASRDRAERAGSERAGGARETAPIE